MVCCKRGLQPVDGWNPLGEEDACVVDENVELLVSSLEIVSQLPDRILRGQICHHRINTLVATPSPDLEKGRLSLVLIPRNYHDGCVKFSKTQRCSLAYARIGACYQADLACHIDVTLFQT